MDERLYCIFGFAAPTVSLASIAASILLSPWFSWRINALSDLGHATRSSVSPIFNLGLLLGGFFMVIYVGTIFRRYSKYTSVCITVSAFTLQLIATFNEVYPLLHLIVSVLFFLSIGVSLIVYSIEKKVYVALLAFFISLLSWITYERLYDLGVAVPETVSSLAVSSFIVYSAARIYLGKDKSDDYRTRKDVD